MKMMKNVLMVLVLAGVLGCGGDDPAGPGGGTPQGAGMTAKIDGETWTALTAFGFRGGGLVSVGGANLNGEFGIGFGFQDMGVGDYVIGPGSTANGNVTDLDGNTWVASVDDGSGTISVTTLTAERIAGTFRYTAPRRLGDGGPDQRVVTEGVFDVPITNNGR